MKQKILGTGLSGMIGSRIVELLSNGYEFEDLSLEEGVDIRDSQKVKERIGRSKAEIVLHLAAKTDVDSCEQDKRRAEKGEAYQVNVLGTKNVAQAAERSGKKIIYISTDFVFDGKKPPDEGYTEKDTPHPINWYGQTKYEGEKIVKTSKVPFLILRTAFPYRAFFPKKKDFVRAILEKFKKGEKIKAASDQIITPTFIDDIAAALDILIKKKARGLYHLVGSQSLLSYKAVCLIATQFDLDSDLISCVKMNSYYSRERAPRPKKLALRNEKIKELGVRMKGFKEGLREIKRQIQELE